MIARYLLAAAPVALCASPCLAGDKVLYQPAPAWVEPAKLPSPDVEPGKMIRYLSQQVRFDDGVVSQYAEQLLSLKTPEALTQMGTVSANWYPDKGDLIVHTLALRRGGRTIDLLANGTRFEILRREQGLERRALDGMQTATVTVPGAQAGDELLFAYTITSRDQALGGEYEWSGIILPQPIPLVKGNIIASWPADSGVKQAFHRYSGATPTATGLRVELPIAKLEDAPPASPSRFNLPPLVQLSSFDSYREVSDRLAPHYVSEGLIKEGGDLDKRVAQIAQRHAAPIDRAAAALRLVQEEVSYQYNGMDGGNYLPQPPETTWQLRYGDCKAKSFLLLSILQQLGVESQIVLVSSNRGDAIPELLPMPSNFDHMIVHAAIAGKDYWLDGTMTGIRKPMLDFVPSFVWALPVIKGGSELVPVRPGNLAQPLQAMDITLDQTAGIAVPALFDVTLTFAGPYSAPYRTLATMDEGEQKSDALRAVVDQTVGESRSFDHTIAYDEETGQAVVRAKGVISSSWRRNNGRYELSVPYQPASSFGFDIDRTRRAWRDVPIRMNAPYYQLANVTVLLPPKESEEDYRLLGKAEFEQTIGRNFLRSQGRLDGNTLRLAQSVMSRDWELPADEVSAAKRDTVLMQKSLARLFAPREVRDPWQYHGKDRARLRPLEAAYAKLIEAEKDEDELATLYVNRARFRYQTADWSGAAADLTTAIGLKAQTEDIVDRAQAYIELGQFDKALADLREKESIEPDGSTYWQQVQLLALLGRKDEALSLATEYGGFAKKVEDAELMQAEAYGWTGRHADGKAIMDRLAAAEPNDADLLNAACWYAGTWNLASEAAMLTCDRAVELSKSSGPALDSRALMFYRLGQSDRAVADLDTVLAANPAMHGSRYLRGLIRLSKGDRSGQDDVDQALAASPFIRTQYAAYGLTPAK